jgi:peptidoglycan/xylan/chitin deacetylase (PgdA/CDA1 family)
LLRSGALWYARRELSRQSAIVVLALHRVLDDDARRHTASMPGMIVRSGTFEAMTKYVARYYETADPLADKPGHGNHRLRFAFTFDDGWLDNARIALPVAQRQGIPLTIFVCTRMLNSVAPFWPERVAARMREADARTTNPEIESVIERLKKAAPAERERAARNVRAHLPHDRTLSLRNIEQMRNAGVRFGSHTRTHAILTDLAPESARTELAGSKADLEEALRISCGSLSYPNGNTSPQVLELVREAGFERAFSTERCAWTADCDPLSIPRMCVWEGSFAGLTGRFSPAIFEYTMIWRAWRATAMRKRGRATVPSYETAEARS